MADKESFWKGVVLGELIISFMWLTYTISNMYIRRMLVMETNYGFYMNYDGEDWFNYCNEFTKYEEEEVESKKQN